MNPQSDNYANESYSELAYEDKQFSKLMIIILLVLGVVIMVLIAANVVSGYTAEVGGNSSANSSAMASSQLDTIIQNIANRPNSADDLLQNANTVFASGSITNPEKCFTDTVYDNFGGSTFDSNGLTVNTYDANKWYVSATADSAYVNQNSLAVYITQGNEDKGVTNVISNNQITGDFDVSISLKNLPKGSTGWLAFKLGIWFGVQDYSIYAFRNQSDELEFFLAHWDGNQLVYYNPNGNSSFSSETFKVKVNDDTLPTELEISRVGTKLAASITNSNETEIVGMVDNALTDDVYLVHSLNVGGTNELQAAVADDFSINNGCFK